MTALTVLLTDRVTPTLQAGAQGTPVRFRARATVGRAFIELLLRHVSLFLRTRIHARSDDGARDATQDQTGTRVARSGNESSQNRAPDRPGGGAGSGRVGGLDD